MVGAENERRAQERHIFGMEILAELGAGNCLAFADKLLLNIAFATWCFFWYHPSTSKPHTHAMHRICALNYTIVLKSSFSLWSCAPVCKQSVRAGYFLLQTLLKIQPDLRVSCHAQRRSASPSPTRLQAARPIASRRHLQTAWVSLYSLMHTHGSMRCHRFDFHGTG